MSTHPSTIPVEDLLKECDQIRTRRSGPGGQHRNKVESAVVITHRETGISSEASERRSQHENRRKAIFRLRVALAVDYRSEMADRDATPQPSELWQSRCDGQIRVNSGHQDFPALLAEALDAVARYEFEVSDAAKFLSSTTSQLVKFFKLEPRAFALVTEHREKKGLRRLR